MIRKLLIILLLLILQKGMLFCQSFEIIPPTKIQNFNDILDVNFESDSLIGTSCYLELKISINGTQEMLGVTNSINIDEYRVGDFHFVSKKTENEKLTKIISNNGELQHGEYLIEYLIIDFASQKQLNSIVVEYTIEHKNGKPICVIIAGSYYLHDESYMDQLSNRHWRGLLVMNEVQDGHFDEMFLSIEYLKRKYGGQCER